jgi:hypothetical protein
MISPNSGSKNKPSRAMLATCFMLVSRLAYSLTLKLEATCSSETSADFQLTTWCFVHHLHLDRRKTFFGSFNLYVVYNMKISEYE